MCSCWSMDPVDRPRFSEISETLNTFKNQGSDYERLQTKDIEDEYYLVPASNEDKPIYQMECDDEWVIYN